MVTTFRITLTTSFNSACLNSCFCSITDTICNSKKNPNKSSISVTKIKIESEVNSIDSNIEYDFKTNHELIQ